MARLRYIFLPFPPLFYFKANSFLRIYARPFWSYIIFRIFFSYFTNVLYTTCWFIRFTLRTPWNLNSGLVLRMAISRPRTSTLKFCAHYTPILRHPKSIHLYLRCLRYSARGDLQFCGTLLGFHKKSIIWNVSSYMSLSWCQNFEICPL